MPIATAWEFGQGLQLSCYLSEGVATTLTAFEPSGQLTVFTFSVEIKKGDIVQIDPAALAGDVLVVKVADADYDPLGDPSSATELGAIGIVITEPEMINTPASSPFTLSAAVDMRRATVEWFGFSATRNVTITEDNVAGMPVGFDGGAAEFTSATASVPFRPFLLVESSSAGAKSHVLI